MEQTRSEEMSDEYVMSCKRCKKYIDFCYTTLSASPKMSSASKQRCEEIFTFALNHRWCHIEVVLERDARKYAEKLTISGSKE